jgi:hypothetical protein
MRQRSMRGMTTVASTLNGAAPEIDPLDARRAAAAVRGIASPLHATAAGPLWRALSDEGALWLLTPPPRAGGR